MDPKINVCATPGLEHLVLGFSVHDGRIYAVGGQGRDLFFTSDDGVTFKQGSSPGPGLRSVHARADGVWVVGEYGYIARTRDGGASWTRMPTKSSACLFGVAEDADRTLWFGGENGFLWSSADGEKLKRVPTKESVGRLACSPLGVLLPTDTPGRLYFIRGGKLEQSSLEAGKEVMQATVTPAGTIVTAGLEGQVYRSEDAGRTFTRVRTQVKCMLTGVDSFEDGRVVIVGEEGTILLSTDDGRTFSQLEQFATAGTLWCVKRYRTAILIGCEGGRILRLGELAPVQATGKKPEPSREKAAPSSNPAWAAPPPSTARQTWTPPPPLPMEVQRGVYVTPELRAMLYPRRGGIAVTLRPLPTVEESWAALRRALWAADRAYVDAKKARSGIWDLVTSHDLRERRRGERILAVNAQKGSEEDDVGLVSMTLQRYRTFIVQFHDVIWEALADFLVASVGLDDAVRRFFQGLDDELPYMNVGPFGRLRDLMVLADDATHARAVRAVKESLATESPKAQAKNDHDRLADLHWVATFLLPGDREVHDAAMRFVGEFGNDDVRACGLASGDLATLELYRKKNRRTRHEFFSPNDRMYLASMLEVEGSAVAEVLAKMKPADPFNDDPHYNGLWSRLLAHVDHDAALEALQNERKSKVGRIWGTAALLLAARCNPERVRAFAKSKGDDELVALIDKKAEAPSEPPVVQDLGDLGAPLPYEPPPAVHPVRIATKVTVPSEATWRDEEREQARAKGVHDDAVKWDGVPLRKCSPEALAQFVAHREKWAIPTAIEDLVLGHPSLHPRLMALGFRVEQYWTYHALPRVLVSRGVDALPLLLAALQTPDALEGALVAAQPFGDVSIARQMVEAFAGKKHKAFGRSWILRHPVHAAAGAIALLAGGELEDPVARVLRYLDVHGKRDVVMEHAAAHGVADRVREMLERDPLSAPKVKLPVVPKYASASALPALVDSAKRVASAKDVDRLLLELAYSNLDEVHPGVLAAKAKYTPASRAAFAWALFEAWLAASADPKHGWCMQAVGFLGDDESARKLAALAKQWPGEGKSVRAQAALDALLNIGTDAALVNINLLAEKSRFPAFKAAAGERIAAIADARGLTTDELQDRLAPSLGLEEEGGNVLDYGKRKFTIEFDERLAPVLRDATGAFLTDAPKPGKTDDAARAKEAKARFSGLKKDARTSASLQVSRLERAMRTGRVIAPGVFLECFVRHPWMRFLAQRLVWATLDANGKIERSFRVAADGSLANVADDPFELPKDGRVVVAHPLQLDPKDRVAWSKVFADYAILQPFPQLGRPVFEATDAERAARTIERFRGKKTTYGALRGLEARGWEKWVDDMVGGMAYPVGRNTWVLVSVEPGWHPSETAETIGPQTIDAVVMHAPEETTFGTLALVMFSEIVHDVDLLAPAAT